MLWYKKVLLTSGCALAALISTSAWAQVKSFDIPAQQAAQAIQEYGRQAGRQIIAPGDQLRGVTTNAVKGEIEASAALAALLQGTGLIVVSDDGVRVIVRKASPSSQSGAIAAAPPSEHAETFDIGELVVTGSRGRPRTVTESSAPIDVIGADQLKRLGGSQQLRDALTQIVPSFQTQTVPSSSWDAVSRPAGLRGLGGAHVLVLVNGKRRHNSSLINLASGNVSNGSNPVDLDLIPDSAISRVEVLRDGAAAQYGSDAIAGVINIILKDADNGGELSFNAGQRYNWGGVSEGETFNFDIYKGFALGESGYLTVSANGRLQNATIRNAPATGNFYFPINGQPDPRELTVDKRHVYPGGLPKNSGVNFAANAGYSVGNVELYSTATLSFRKAKAGQGFRRPNSNQNVIEIFPNGYAPFYRLEEKDFQVLAGARGEAADWAWDLSTTYGGDRVDNGATNTLNTSLGPASPTSFKTFRSEFHQWTNNLDLKREIMLGSAEPLAVAVGFEHRWEEFKTTPLDPLAYANGRYVYPAGYGTLAGTAPSAGAQGAILVLPGDAANISRNVYAAYVDVSTDITSAWSIDVAGRFEHYDDSAGDVLSGKVSTRYAFNDAIAVRGTVSSGFRAPSLPQAAFAQTATQNLFVNGVLQSLETKTVRVDSPVGIALGSKPLEPETSTNVSVGIALTPTPRLSATIDAYRIKLNDRIMRTGLLGGAGVNTILAANGFTPVSIQYFANAIDTVTEGVDAVATYRQPLWDDANLQLSAAFNYNKTSIANIAANPSELGNLNLTLFDRMAQGAVADNAAKTKVILGAILNTGPVSINLRQTRYGKFAAIQSVAANDQSYGAEWITDLDIAYNLTDRVTVSVGANNVFDKYPDESTLINTSGIQNYGNAPFGFYGGYYYMRFNVKF